MPFHCAGALQLKFIARLDSKVVLVNDTSLFSLKPGQELTEEPIQAVI
jgi:hypothetical protein